MKKALFLVMVNLLVLSGCEKSSDDPVIPPVKPDGVTWTDDQWKTIQTLHQVDDQNYLYEMNCLFDYKLDEVLKANSDNLVSLFDAIKNVILPDSETDFTELLRPNMNSIYKYYGGCTCFSANGRNGGYVMGRNYDFPPKDDHTMIVHTPQVKDANGKVVRYATVGTADMGILTQFMDEELGYRTTRMQELTLYAPYFILDGMNEAGLMSGLMVLEYDGTHQTTPGKPNLTNAMITRIILDRCATVREAIDMLQQFNIISIFQVSESTVPWIDMHFEFADKSGDRAVIEWTQNSMQILTGEKLKNEPRTQDPKYPTIHAQKGDNYVIATNYYLSKDAMEFPEDQALSSEMGFWRHDVVDSLLYLKQSVNSQEAMDICHAARIMKNDPDCIEKMKILLIHDPTLDIDNKFSWPWITIWSSVYNNEDMSVLFCSREDFDRRYKLSL